MEKESKIYISGNGVAGSAVSRLLKQKGYYHILERSSDELDLRNQHSVDHFFKRERPDYVFLTPSGPGGIMTKKHYCADIIYEHLTIEMNVIHAAWKYGTKKLLFLGNSCVYPELTDNPIREENLLRGKLDPIQESFSIAKIAGIKM
ncbi:MAG TPA: NAD-dependent epimerase/dehydratase family protein, partial [Flavisolibacter sp.]|nr:NAD-dependent epimerase/dehydratase family protein [Flavisolibacter sp.]